MSKDAPVVGLLFGRYVDDNHNNSRGGNRAKVGNNASSSGSISKNHCVKIVDADDIPTDRSEAAKSQVSLHHAVFPQHEVVGWYRVGNSEEPTASDLALTQELKAHYYSDEAASAHKSFFFSLLQVRPPKDNSAKQNNTTKGNNMKEDSVNDGNDDDDDELPLNLYEIQIRDGSPVLVAVEHWSLETSEAERIAVERVVREQPQQDLKKSATTITAGSSGNAKSDNAAEEQATSTNTPQPSAYVNYMTSVLHSLQAMDDRIKLIIDYLERMGKGEIPPNHSLLRQIQGLILQLGPLQQASATRDESIPISERDSELFAHLAAVAKTIQSVHSYTEKFRTLNENRQTGGREGRRGY